MLRRTVGYYYSKVRKDICRDVPKEGAKRIAVSLAKLFHCGVVVALPSLIYQLHFITHFAVKLLPRISHDCSTFLVALQKTSVSFADSLQYLPLGEYAN